MNATLSLWIISITDLYRRDTFEFCNLSGCEKLVRYPPCNRLDRVITDASDIVDVFLRTPLVTSGQCFVSCTLRVEQSVPEYNGRSSLSEASYQLKQCLLCSQELYMEHNFEIS